MARPYQITINGEKWRYRALPEVEYLQAEDASSLAITHPDRKEIVFLREALTEGIVRHEVFHALVSQLCINSANLTAIQMEEVAAEVIEKHFDLIGKLTKKVYTRLVK